MLRVEPQFQRSGRGGDDEVLILLGNLQKLTDGAGLGHDLDFETELKGFALLKLLNANLDGAAAIHRPPIHAQNRRAGAIEPLSEKTLQNRRSHHDETLLRRRGE